MTRSVAIIDKFEGRPTQSKKANGMVQRAARTKTELFAHPRSAPSGYDRARARHMN